MNKIVSFFLVVLFWGMLMTGCKATPQNEIVVRKNNPVQIDDKNYDTKETTPLNAPETWEEEVAVNDQFIIRINASISTPEVEHYPILQVKPAKFLQEDIDDFKNYFIKDKKLFVWPADVTKEELEQELISFKRGQLVDGEYMPPSPDDPYLSELEKMIAEAPESTARKYIEPLLQTDDKGIESLTAAAEWSPTEDVMFTIENFCDDTYHSIFIFQRGGNMMDESIAELNGMTLRECNISENDAKQIAQKAIEDLGITNMYFSSIRRSQMDKLGSFAGMTSDYESSGYEVIYMPKYNNIPSVDTSDGGVYDIMSSSTIEYLPAYNAPWYQERIIMYIDENGVQRFSWGGYTKVEKVVSDDADILTFEEVQERIKKQIYYQNGVVSQGMSSSINVNKITLGLSLINKANEPGVGLLVPAWNVFYENETSINDETFTIEGFLVINALDGSVIDPLPKFENQ